MSPGGELSRDAQSVLRVLFRYRGTPASGSELMERLFATTSEVPLDPSMVSAAIRELVAAGFVTLDTQGRPDPGFDFVLAAITDLGRAYITS